MYADIKKRRLSFGSISIFRRAFCVMDLATDEYRLMVRRYVAALSRSQVAVDDLAQEVFVRAIERIDRLHSADKAAAFLRGIARHVVQEHFRQQRRDRRCIDYDETMLHSLVSDDQVSVLGICENRQLLGELREAVSELPVVSRRMLEMRYHDSMNAPQIANVLGIEPTAVRVSLLRIRQRLAKRLTTQDFNN